METFWSILADPTMLAALSALSTVVAVPIAFAALMSSHRTARRMVEIEEARDLAAERQASRACLTAEGQRSYVGSHAHLITGGEVMVVNQGGGAARRVRVSVDGVDVTSSSTAPLDASGGMDRLDPGAMSRIRIKAEEAARLSFRRIRVEWEDGSGEPGLYESDL